MNGWTPDREAKAKALWLKGYSAAQISRVIGGGLSRNAVIGKIHRLGLSSKGRGPAAAPSPYMKSQVTFTPEMDARLREMSQEGITKANAALRLDVSDSRVWDRVRALGLEWKAPAKRTETERTIKKPRLIEQDVEAQTVFVEPSPEDAIPLIARTFGQCSWPVGTPDRPAGQMCCGHKVPEGATGLRASYCAHHAKLAIARTPTPLRLPREPQRVSSRRVKPVNDDGLWDMVA